MLCSLSPAAHKQQLNRDRKKWCFFQLSFPPFSFEHQQLRALRHFSSQMGFELVNSLTDDGRETWRMTGANGPTCVMRNVLSKTLEAKLWCVCRKFGFIFKLLLMKNLWNGIEDLKNLSEGMGPNISNHQAPYSALHLAHFELRRFLWSDAIRFCLIFDQISEMIPLEWCGLILT